MRYILRIAVLLLLLALLAGCGRTAVSRGETSVAAARPGRTAAAQSSEPPAVQPEADGASTSTPTAALPPEPVADPSLPLEPMEPIELSLYEPVHAAFVTLEQPAGMASTVSELLALVGRGLGLTIAAESVEQQGEVLTVDWDPAGYQALGETEAGTLLQSAERTLRKNGFALTELVFRCAGETLPFTPEPGRALKLEAAEVAAYLAQIEYGGIRDNLAELYPIVHTLQPDINPEWIRLLCYTTPRREGENWESYKLRTALRYTPLYSTTVGGEDPPPTPLLYLAGAAGLDGDLLIAREADRVAGTLFGESLRHRDVDRYTYREPWGLYTGWGASGEVWLPYILETREEGELLTVRLCYLPAFIGETVEIFDGEGNPWPLEDAAALATRQPRYRATLRKTDAGYQLKGLEDE